MSARPLRVATTALLALALAGCAGGGRLAPPPAPAPTPATVPVSPPPAPRGPASPAAPDTVPSSDALRVLANIPEPLPGAPEGPPPTASAERERSAHEGPASPAASTPAHAVAAVDTAAASRPAPPAADSTLAPADTASVPVPAPTQPLASPALLPAAVPPPVVTPPPPPPTRTVPDTCWRVQVGAPTERAKGRKLRDASESLLVVPMIVDREGGRWKVRTRDCLTRVAAESLRERAVASGFKGVFLVKTVEKR